MKIEKRQSYRKPINDHCKSCGFDQKAKGTWRQQITLCPITNCALYPIRPVTERPIPEVVLNYFGVGRSEIAVCGSIRPQEERFNEHDATDPCPAITAE